MVLSLAPHVVSPFDFQMPEFRYFSLGGFFLGKHEKNKIRFFAIVSNTARQRDKLIRPPYQKRNISSTSTSATPLFSYSKRSKFLTS